MAEYTKSYERATTVMVEGFDAPLLIPEQPPPDQIINFGLPIEQQKFKLEESVHWERMSDQERDAHAKSQWHKRFNGLWFYIKGNPYYIPGWYWLYCNYYTTEGGGLPEFRMEGLEFSWIWENAVRSKSCFGILDIKPRRIGDTDKALCFLWDLSTRYRNSRLGTQNIVEKDAKENFKRLNQSVINAMPPWFLPQTKDGKTEKDGSVSRETYTPEEEIEFKANSNTSPLWRDKMLNTTINFRATKLKAYDGKKLRGYLLDEWGKIYTSAMPIPEQWDIIKECLALNNGKNIVGKAILPSTIEFMEGTETVTVATDLWEKSDPRVVNEMGQTGTGLWRVFRSHENTAEIDEWGFHKKEEARRVWHTRVSQLIRDKKGKGVMAYKRKFPASIDDALVTSADSCVLHGDLLDARKAKIGTYQDDPPDFWNEPVIGDLIWSTGKIGSNLIFQPNKGGLFIIAQPPVQAIANRKNMHREGHMFPMNTSIYSAGADPYDHTGKSAVSSDAALSIFRHQDVREENTPYHINELGLVVYDDPERCKTNKFVAAYRYRHADPKDCYRDMIKLLMWYGADCLIETNKPGFKNFLNDVKCGGYVAFPNSNMGVVSSSNKESGLASTTPTIELYTTELSSYIYNYSDQLDITPMIADFRRFTGDNRTKCDLMVSAGFALLNCLGKEMASGRRNSTAPTDHTAEPARFPFQTYDN